MVMTCLPRMIPLALMIYVSSLYVDNVTLFVKINNAII